MKHYMIEENNNLQYTLFYKNDCPTEHDGENSCIAC